MPTLWDQPLSGNCYKVRLLLAQLGIEYERVEVGLLHEGSRPDALLALNPNGRVPVLELDDGRVLAESNAILWHLAEGTPLSPDDAFDRARILQWMFFEQNGPEPNIGVARYHLSILERPAAAPEVLATYQKLAQRSLRVMDRHLDGNEFFVDRYGVADIALYAYAHVAPEAGVALDPFPAVRAWIARVESRPAWLPMKE